MRRTLRNEKAHTVELLKNLESSVVIGIRCRNTLWIHSPRLVLLRFVCWVELKLMTRIRKKLRNAT